MSDYTPLTDDEVAFVLKSVWARQSLRTDRQDQPILILVGGQPGAGKTAATNWAKHGLSRTGGFVHIDTDAFHANVEEIRKEVFTSPQTHEDCKKIAVRLRELAMESGRNVLEEGVFRQAGILEERLETARRLGYRCELVGVATSREVSRLSVLERRESFREYYGFIRDVPEKKQEQGFAGFTENIVKSANKYDRVRIVNRDGELLYDSAGRGKYRSVAESLKEGRKLTDAQIAKLSERWDALLKACIEKNIPPDQLERVHDSRAQFEAFKSGEKHLHGKINILQNAHVLARDPRFILHSDKELEKAAYYRGVCEKDYLFRGKEPDFASVDTLLSKRDTLEKLPDVAVESKTVHTVDRLRNIAKGGELEI
jgi:predicted ABC-type ATPase